jgi:hypothetical protein
MSARTLRLTLWVGLLSTPAACELPDNDSRPPDLPMTVLLSVTPTHGATYVGPTQAIIARFKGFLETSTIDGPSFKLESPAGPIPGEVTILANGKDARFKPDDPLSLDVTFTATVKGSIQSPSHQPLGTDYVWSFTTGLLPLEWSDAALVETSSGDIPLNYAGPHVATDEDENSCAVWTQSDGSVYRVYASRASQGGAWSAPTAIPGSSGGFTPFVAVRDGQAMAVWVQGYSVWASRASMTGTWSAAEVVTSDTGPMGPGALGVFWADQGHAIVYFYEAQSGNPSNNVYAVQYDPDDGWQPRTFIPTWYNLGYASFEADASGTVVAVWASIETGSQPEDNRVMARRFTAATGWSPDETVDAHIPGRPVQVMDVAMDGAGNAKALWMRRNEGAVSNVDNEMHFSIRGPSTAWSAAETVPAPAEHYPFLSAWGALSADGSVAFTWDNYTDARCWAILRDAEGNWTPPEAVEPVTPLAGYWGRPFFSGPGRFEVLGYGNVGVGAQQGYGLLWNNTYHPVTGWGSPEVTHTGTGAILAHSLDADSIGRAAVIWKESNTPGYSGLLSVYSARFR